MKVAVTPHKVPSKQTTCNTERPSYKQSPQVQTDMTSGRNLAKPQNLQYNKENCEILSPEDSNGKNLQKKKQRSVRNQSKILKILNLTTKYEGLEDPEREMPAFYNESIEKKSEVSEVKVLFSKSPIPSNKSSERNLKVEKNESESYKNLQKPGKTEEKESKPQKIFTQEEALRYPLEFYESFDSLVALDKKIEDVIESLSVKTLMTVKSLIKPDTEILRICGAFSVLQGRTTDSRSPFSWSSIQKILGSPSQILAFIRNFRTMAQAREFSNLESLKIARNTLLQKGPLLQNSENSLILETMKKMAIFSILALRYIEIIEESPDFRRNHHENPSNNNHEKSPYTPENFEKLIEKPERCFSRPEEIIDNEFIEEERPMVLKVCPSKQQVFADASEKPDKSPVIYKSPKKPKHHTRLLISEEVFRPKGMQKSPYLQKKESKLDKVMKIKVRKPKVVSQVRLFLQGEYSSEKKPQSRTKSLNISQDSNGISKRDVSEPIGERLIREDIDCLKKEMRKLDMQKNRLNNAFVREVKKVEEFKELKEQSKKRQMERELERKFQEKKQFEEKMARKARNLDKTEEVSNNRKYKKKVEREKKSVEKEEFETYEKHHTWLEKSKEVLKNERKEKNKHEYQEIEWKRDIKRQVREEEKTKLSTEIQKNRESSLMQTHKDMLSKKEKLEKQLEETLGVIMRIRESYKDLDL